MKKYIISAGAAASTYAVPFVALAQARPGLPADTTSNTGTGGPTLGNLNDIVVQIGVIVDMLIPIAFALGLLFFFWGLAKYILAAADEAKKAEGKNIMIWGVIALFIMASIWGIVGFMRSALGISGDETQTVPYVGNIPGVTHDTTNVVPGQ